MPRRQYSKLQTYSLKLVKEKSCKYPVECVDYPEQAFYAMQEYLQDKDREHLVVIMLDGQNKLIGMSTVAIGGIAGLASNPRDVLKVAIVANASGIILGHNHPSGSLEPSPQDIMFTRCVQEACVIMGIIFLDHIIVSSSINPGITSFYKRGILTCSEKPQPQT